MMRKLALHGYACTKLYDLSPISYFMMRYVWYSVECVPGCPENRPKEGTFRSAVSKRKSLQRMLLR